MTGPIFDTHAHYSARTFDTDRFALLDSLPAGYTVLAEGGTNRVIVIHSDQVSDLDIDEGLAMMKTLNQEEFQVMKTMTGQ